jgi:hypothetical protein
VVLFRSNYRVRSPQPGEVTAQVITSPYAIAIISSSPLPVTFKNVTPTTTAQEEQSEDAATPVAEVK